MSNMEILDTLEEKVKNLVSDLKNARSVSQTTESSTLDITNKLAKIELKIKNLLSILEK
tara:strand:+ start:158 stop:334 length:177 start_codon:yes stop_codon:yes gene_type:complete